MCVAGSVHPASSAGLGRLPAHLAQSLVHFRPCAPCAHSPPPCHRALQVEENTDTWVLQRLGAQELYKQGRAAGTPWTQLMDHCLQASGAVGAGQRGALQGAGR